MNNEEHWVCNNCIGSNNVEDLTIGLADKAKCEFCHKEFVRNELRYISHNMFLYFLKNKPQKDSLADLHIRRN